MRSLVVPLLLVVVAMPARAADTKKPAKITYDDHVLPLLRESCLGCHNPDKKKAGLILSNYTKLMEGSGSGAVVKPGDPEGSPLFLVVSHKQEPFMPPKSPMLAREKLDLIQRWIAGGALENSGSKAIIANKPAVDFTLPKVTKGKPEGPPPMPPATLALEPIVYTTRANAITALASSPWAPLLAVGGQKQVVLYHSETLELLGVLPFPEGVPHVLEFSRNGSLLLAGGGHAAKSGRVVVWSVTQGKRLFEVGDELDCVLAASISPDQTMIALAGPSKVVRIYSTRDGKLMHEIRKHTDWVTALEFSPDGVLLASGDRNGGLFVWEAFTAREYFSLRGHTAAITQVSWRADGNVLASASEDTTVPLREMENGGQIRSWGAHGGGVLSVRCTHDGQIVSCGRDRLTKVWDGNGGARRAFEALPDVALRTTFSHDGKRVVAGDWTGEIFVWATADGKRLGAITPNPPPPAVQLETARKALAVCEKDNQQRQAALQEVQAQLKATEGNLARLQGLVTNGPASIQKAQQAAAAAKTALDRARTALTSATADVKAKQLVARVLAEAVAKVRAEADRVKTDAALAAAATRMKGLADQAATEAKQAEKPMTAAAAAVKKAETDLSAAELAVKQTMTAAQTAAKNLPAAQAALKNVQTQTAATRAAADQATVALKNAQAQVTRWQAFLARAQKSK